MRNVFERLPRLLPAPFGTGFKAGLLYNAGMRTDVARIKVMQNQDAFQDNATMRLEEKHGEMVGRSKQM